MHPFVTIFIQFHLQFILFIIWDSFAVFYAFLDFTSYYPLCTFLRSTAIDILALLKSPYNIASHYTLANVYCRFRTTKSCQPQHYSYLYLKTYLVVPVETSLVERCPPKKWQISKSLAESHNWYFPIVT